MLLDVSWPEPVDFVLLLDLSPSTIGTSVLLEKDVAGLSANECLSVGSCDRVNIPWLSGAIAPTYSSGDLVRLVPRGLGCESRFGAMVEAVRVY
jgi:hypothetical protein